MAAWEYAFLHGVSTIRKPLNFQEPGPLAFVLQSMTGNRIIDGADGLLDAFNKLGADGWVVQVPEVWEAQNAPEWIRELVDPTLDNFEVFQSWTYFIRRERGPDSEPTW